MRQATGVAAVGFAVLFDVRVGGSWNFGRAALQGLYDRAEHPSICDWSREILGMNAKAKGLGHCVISQQESQVDKMKCEVDAMAIWHQEATCCGRSGRLIRSNP